MKNGWFLKLLNVIYTLFTRKQEVKKPSLSVKTSKEIHYQSPVPAFFPDSKYSTWYRKTFLRPRRKVGF